MQNDELAFRSATHVAELATAGVCFNLATGDALKAAALQPVARAAWELAHGLTHPAALRRVALEATGRLATVCGAGAERRFLTDVLRFVDRVDAPQRTPRAARKIETADD